MYWITYYVGSLRSRSDHSSNGRMTSCARCYCDLSSNRHGAALESPVPKDKHIYNLYLSKVSTKSSAYIYTTIIHQMLVPKGKHIYNQYPSYIVHPPYIKSMYQRASYICKFIDHTMFMITIHCSSTIHSSSTICKSFPTASFLMKGIRLAITTSLCLKSFSSHFFNYWTTLASNMWIWIYMNDYI
jgi:hypothetical protein